MHLLKQTVTMQTEVGVNYLNCHIHVPSKHVLANREANSRHTYDVTIWLSRTTDNSNIFIRSREVRDNESRLYVNDMSGAIHVSHKLLLYADDSAILVVDKSISNTEISLLQKELEVVSDWLVDNKLSLHLGKTESILFGSKSRIKPQSNLQVS